MLTAIKYSELNSRQQENFNFHKIASKLADYGFNCMRLSDDWQGADFLGCHIDGETFLKVQLKGRLTFSKKYQNKNIYIAFRDSETWYLYPHDTLLSFLTTQNKIIGTSSWDLEGTYGWSQIPEYLKNHMNENYAV